MIAWLVSIITAVLLFFIIWRSVSPQFRARAEAPKFKFLESLGIKSHDSSKENPREDRDESPHP